MLVVNPAVADPRTRRNKARHAGMRASGPRSQGLASGIDHSSYVK